MPALLEQLRQIIVEARTKALPSSTLAKACDYTLRLWDRLTVFLKHPAIEIDNNWCENAIRPLALGRKNWLHLGSPQAGKSAAAIVSVIETCHRLAINPREYLLAVLPKIADWPARLIGELTPAAWLRQQPGRS
jgi:hypothetical protein